MRQNLVILTGVMLLVAGTAHAQTPSETPAAQPSAAPAPETAPATEGAAAATPEPAPASTDAQPAESAEAPASDVPPATTTEADATDQSAADAMGAEMSPEELAALGLASEGPTVDTSVHLSGFVDFSVIAGFNATSETVSPQDRAFAIGNLNVYLAKNLNESFRTMIEVRFMYMPNGAGPVIGAPPMNTMVADYADVGRAIHWGGIDIQRVYLDWQATSFLTLRVGEFLTPYGVWNVDHGSPTIIPAAKPYVIGVGFFPSRQTGLEAFGRTDAGSKGTIGYHLTLSNGTGSVPEYRDLDHNKAIGARAFYETRALGEFRLGGSAYYGTNSEGTTSLTFENGELKNSRTLTSQSDQLAFGFDAVWKVSGLHLQAEWLCLQRKFTDEGRKVEIGPTGQPTFDPDSFSWGAYGLIGYRFDWYGVMPFVMYQNLDQPDAVSFHGFHVGVNLRPIDALAVKLQYDNIKSEDLTFSTGYVQVAWAF
jgi:hypothetical protein